MLHPEFLSWVLTDIRSIGISIGCAVGASTILMSGANVQNFAAKAGLFGSAVIMSQCGLEALKTHKQMRQKISQHNLVAEVHGNKIMGSLMEAFYKNLPMLQTSVIDVPILPALPPAQPLYDWNSIADEAVGFLICGNSGSAKSSLATWLAGHLTQSEPMAVIALDPHYNDCWQLAGIKSVGKIEHIEACLEWLIAELDRRCERKGDGLPLGDPMFIICDEINAALERFAKPKIIESALKRLGSEGRKFDLTFCGLNQSSNAEALGIDSKYRSNYALILLGESARTHAKLGKFLQDIAYPCLVTGSIANSIATHPTHGSYQQFKKKGNPPMNLKPINHLPLPRELAKFVKGLDRALPSSEPELNESVVNHLNRLYSIEIQDSDSDSIVAVDTRKDEESRLRIAELKASGLNQNQIILAIWQAKAGGNKAYQNALAEYRRLS